MFMIYLHSKFHIPSFSDSLVIAVKLKTKEHFRTVVMLSYLKKESWPELHIFKLSIPIHNQEHVLSGTGVASTAQVRASAMLLLSIAGN
jgi:hypothetical protein